MLTSPCFALRLNVGPEHSLGNASDYDYDEDEEDAALVLEWERALELFLDQEERLNRREAIIPTRVMGLQRSGNNLWEMFEKQLHLPAHHCNMSDSDGHVLHINAAQRHVPCWRHFRIQWESFLGDEEDQSKNRHPSHITKIEDLDKMTGVKNQNLKYIVTIKSPLAWTTSDCRYHHSCAREGIHQKNMQEWVNYVSKWIDLQSEAPNRIALVPYEGLLMDPDHVFQQMDQWYGTDIFWRARSRLVNTKDVPQSKKNSFGKAKHKYLHCTYLSEIPHSMHRKLLEMIDQKITNKLQLTFDNNGCIRSFRVD